MLSFASFGVIYTDQENGVIYDFEDGKLIIYGTGTITGDSVDKAIGRNRDEVDYSVEEIIIKNGITSIGAWTFYNCVNLTSVTIPSSVISIGDSAFNWCKALTSIAIPNSVETIGNNAFSSCSNLTEIKVEGENVKYRDIDGVLFTKDGKQLVCYPAGKVGTSYIIPNSVETIGNGAFYGCESLTGITLSNSVTKIDSGAFDSCASLKSVIMPSSVTSIGDVAFYNSALKDVYYLGTETQWELLKANISPDNDDLLYYATIHYNCKPKTLIVKKVWKDGKGNSGLRSNPKLVLYIKKSGGSLQKANDTEYQLTNFKYNTGNGIYQEVKFGSNGKVTNDGGKDEWLCNFIIYDHKEGNTYAVSEDAMEGYTSTAPTPAP